MSIKELIEVLKDYPEEHEVRIGTRRHIHKDTIYEDAINKTIYLN